MGLFKRNKKTENTNTEEYIIRFARSPNWKDRLYAISLISKNLNDVNLSILLKFLSDPDWSVSKEAEEVFLRSGFIGKEYLLRYGLTGQNDTIRRRSYKILVKMGYKREALLSLASFYENSRNYEKAAELYEKAGELEKAHEIRMKNKEIYVYQKNVNIDINIDSILNYLRTRGEAIQYKCPACGAQLEIDGKSNIHYCPYCGSKIKVTDIQKILEDMINKNK